MLALPASEAYSENLTCEGTFPNCKDILKLIVFILGVSATSLPEGAFYRLSLPPPIMGISAALFRETVYGSTDTDLDPGSLLCFHYKHPGFRLQPFPHAELHWSPMCWEPSGRNPTITEQSPYRLGLNAVSAWTFWGMLWGPILQSFNMQNSPGPGRFGNYSRLRSTASRSEHQGGALSQNGP